MVRIKPYIKYAFLFLVLALSISCTHTTQKEEDVADADGIKTVIKRRDDGTISSINQVVDGKLVHGVRTTYYGDGKTIYSKHTFNYGKKQGPANWYYTNGQIFKQTNFEDGERDGLTRVYYKNGTLSARFESERGIVLPGLKEYDIDGQLLTSYPGVEFREIDHLSSNNRVDLEVYCTKKRSGVKFYLLKEEAGETSRVYLITKNDRALMQFYVKPGEALNKKIEILAEIPTELGNVLVRKYTYQLSVAH